MSATIHHDSRDSPSLPSPLPPAHNTATAYTPLSPNPVLHTSLAQTLRPTPLTQAGVCSSAVTRNLRIPEDQDYAQIIKTRSPVKQMSCDYESRLGGGGGGLEPPSLTYDYPPTHRETIERYIAVPISSTDHLLISSTGSGQHYLAEPVSNLLSDRLQERMAASYNTHATTYNRFPPPAITDGSTYDKPPPPLPAGAPGYERPAPLGANSRATSKMSLDCIDKLGDEETNF